MASKLELDFGITNALRDLDTLKQKLQEVEDKARGLASTLGGSGGGTPQQQAEFRNAIEQVQGIRGAIGSIQNSASVSGHEVVAAANAAAGVGIVNRSIPNPNAFINTVQSLGVGAPALLAASSLTQAPSPMLAGAPSAGQVVSSIITSSQHASFGGGLPNTAAIGPANALRASGLSRFAGALTSPQGAGIALGVGSFIGGAASLYAGNVISGELDPLQAAQLYGRAGGAVTGAAFGAAIGALAPVPQPGLGTLIGAGVGAEAGAAVAAKEIAPFIRTRNAISAVMSFSARSGFSPYDLVNNTGVAGRNLEEISNDITYANKTVADRLKIGIGTYTGTDILSVPQAARATATLGSAFLAAGESPRSLVTEYVASLGVKYGTSTEDISRLVAPVLASRNRFLRNQTDLLLAHGPEAYGAYADFTGLPDLTDPQRGAYRSFQQQQNLTTRAGLQATGSGFASATSRLEELRILGQLPGGRNSLEYAQSYAGFRAARSETFSQADQAGFGLRELALSGQQQRQQYLPFSPGNIFGTSLGIIQNNRQQIDVLSRRLGISDLSEQERYSLESQRQGLLTENARNVGILSEGFENRLPGLAAGRPGFFGRYTSLQSAALALGNIGSPIRAFGAVGGAQAGLQDAFVNSFGNPPGASGPYSTTAGINQTNEILTQILSALRQNIGGGSRVSGMRPNEGFGNMAGGLNQKDLGTERIYHYRN